MNLKNINKLTVYYQNKVVGFLSLNLDSSTTFIYSQDWLNHGFSISPFKLPLEMKEFTCTDYLVNYMFGVFYDCLPDSWGNRLVDKYLTSVGINPSSLTLIQRLSLLDQYSLGALSFKPKFENNVTLLKINEFDVIYDKIQKFIINDEEIDLDLYHNGSSTGGSRPKVNHFFGKDLYIVKFPSKLDPKDIGKKEYELNMLAKECGLDVPDCKLVPSKNSGGYFATKRFDYVNGKKLHVISLAGLFDLNPELSQIHYLGFLQTVKALCPEYLNEAVKRMIFNYLIENKDDHPRNFSFIFDENKHQYCLAPFYDITSTPKIKEHMMQVNGKDEPNLNDFIIDSGKVGVKKEVVIEIYNSLFEKIKKAHF